MESLVKSLEHFPTHGRRFGNNVSYKTAYANATAFAFEYVMTSDDVKWLDKLSADHKYRQSPGVFLLSDNLKSTRLEDAINC